MSAAKVRARVPAVALVVALVVALAALAGCTGGGEPSPDPGPDLPTRLTYAVYGPAAELAAHRRVVDRWNLDNPAIRVDLVTSADREEQAALLASGEDVPDVFLLSRRDLAAVRRAELTQPLGELLDQEGRDVELGDGYPIDAVRAFAGEDELQCMPYGYSPMVIYYNTRLVDFARMERRGLDVPSEDARAEGRWTFAEFAAAAGFAARPATRSAGVHLEPTLEALTPFILSGGGQVYDDPNEPTSLALSDDDSLAALSTTLQLLRNPLVTLSDEQLARQDAVAWFEEGRLGMIAGYRSLTPQLRQAEGLGFDVMTMPSLGAARTVGEATAVCMSREVIDTEAAADFVFAVTGEEAVGEVTAAGYLVPANLLVTTTDAFVQPGRMPRTVQAFKEAIRDIELPPLLDSYDALARVADDDVARLFSIRVLTPASLEAIATRIDQESAQVLAPPTPSASPES